MIKKIAASLFILFAVTSCQKATNTNHVAVESDKIHVTVTFNAMKEIVKAVGGEYVDITTIVPDGMEAHNFEPKVRDMKALSSADIFVYNGFGLESWVQEAVMSSANTKLIVVDSSVGMEPIFINGNEKDGLDPHLWLSLKGTQVQTKNISQALQNVDPKHASEYARNADAYIQELENLYVEYKEKIAVTPSKNFVTGHAAFAYLCKDFGLEQNSVEDVFASGEPNAQKLIHLIDYMRTNKVKTIFVEEMVSPAISQTLANEVGAKVKNIFTIEGSEDGRTYLERMRSNLESIYESLRD